MTRLPGGVSPGGSGLIGGASALCFAGLYVFAIGLHLFMVDDELAEQFQDPYASGGRWLLADRDRN